MIFEDLSPEIKEKALACKSADELVELAKSEGVELSDEQLEGIAGGFNWKGECSDYRCEVVCSAGISRAAVSREGLKAMM